MILSFPMVESTPRTEHFLYYSSKDFFHEAGELYGVDPTMLKAISILETGWGKSRLARERNNLFGYCAYDDDPSRAMIFDSERDSIMAAAKTIGEYFDKGYDLDTIPWASDPDWSRKVREIMKEIHPGETVAKVLMDRGIDPEELCGVLRHERGISESLALGLENVFKMDRSFWLNLGGR